MHLLISTMCWLILGTWLVPAFAQPVAKAQKKLQGSWTATKAERDGKAADDVVGRVDTLARELAEMQREISKSNRVATVTQLLKLQGRCNEVSFRSL